MPIALSDAERDDLMVRCADLCQLAITSYNQYQARGHGDYSSTSPLVRAAKAAARHYGPAGDWSYELMFRLTVRVIIYLLGSKQYVESMRVLLNQQYFGLGLAPLSRSILENTGKVAWLLDNRLPYDRNGARRRVARLLLDIEDDASRRKTIAVQLNHPDRAEAGNEFRAARDAIAKPGAFFNSEISRDASGRIELVGEKLPGPAKLVQIAEQILQEGSASAAGAYGYLSAMTHPTVFAILETLPPRDSLSAATVLTTPVREDAVFSAKLTHYGVVSFYNAWRISASWEGADWHEADALRAGLDEIGSAIDSYSSRQAGP